jgi:hypothetical protein
LFCLWFFGFQLRHKLYSWRDRRFLRHYVASAHAANRLSRKNFPLTESRGAGVMAESNVVGGLVARRGELAGEAEQCRPELQRLADELGHLDAPIRLFDPGYDLGGIRVRRRCHGHRWF